MKHEATNEVLSHLDALLSEEPIISCWRCLKAPGTPSLCDGCRVEVGGYEKPPKGTKRLPWTG